LSQFIHLLLLKLTLFHILVGKREIDKRSEGS